MPLTGFKPTNPASKQPQTYTFECMATRIESTFLLEEIYRLYLLYEYCFRINSYRQTALAFFAVIKCTGVFQISEHFK